MRQNSVPEELSITRTDVTKRKTRGTKEHAVSYDGIVVVRLMDNSVFTVASRVHGVEPLSSADRHSRTERKRVKVPRPNLVGYYNKFMGGTD